MGVDAGEILESEYRSWLTPKEALERTSAYLGIVLNDSHQSLLTHLVDGYIRAVAMHTVIVTGTSRSNLADYRIIKPVIWEKLDASNPAFAHAVWKDATLAVRFQTGRSDPAQEWKHVGVRIEPTGIEKYFPAARQHVIPPLLDDKTPTAWEAAAAVAREASGTKTEKGPPLSPKALTAWYDAYKAAYSDKERNLDHAWDHAKRAFPEKTVTRESVRKLMPGGKPGPKAKG